MAEDEMLVGTKKADFTTIYDQPDPRGYFGTLTPLDYQIPQRALPVIRSVLAASRRDDGSTRPVLDVCCSYGINAALLRYDVDLDDMSRHYTAPGPHQLSATERIEGDAAFFATRGPRPDVAVHGLDAAPNAIAYAKGVGLINDGWAENLEAHDPSTQLAAGLSDVGMIVCTGGVGYIGAPTFARLLNAVRAPEDLWLAVFVLRVFSYAAIATTLSDAGLVTEQVPGVTFPQRRFADAGEQEAAVHDVLGRGLDPTGKEADGWFHADCFISRPAASAARTPLAEILG